MSRYRKTFKEALDEVYLSEKEITKLKNGVKVLGNALPNKALAQKMADKANKEMGYDADVYQSPFNNRFYVRIKEDIKEQDDKDHEISMARGELEAIADKALKLSSILQGKSDEGNPLEAWVQSKITKAKDYVNSVADYMMYNPEMANESHGPTVYSNDNGKIEIVDGEFHVYKGNTKTHHKTLDDAKQELGEAFSDAQVAQLKKAYEPMKGQRISLDNANKLMAIFNKFDNDKGALEKLVKAKIPFVSDLAVSRLISKHSYTADKIRPLKAGYMSEGTMIGGIIKHPGQPSAEYNKARLQYRTFMSKAQPAKGAEDKVLKFVFDDELLDDLYNMSKKNPTKDVRDMVKNRLTKLGVKEELEEATDADKDGEVDGVEIAKIRAVRDKEDKKETSGLEKEVEKKNNEIAMLKTKLENEKNKAVKPEPNPETGEIPLKVGVAYKILRDKMKKEKEEVKEESIDEFNKKDYRKNEDENEHSLNALELVKKFGTSSEIKDMQGIYDRHMKRGHITEPDYSKRNAYDKKYYPKLKEDVEEGRMSDIDAMRKQGASAAKIAKELGLNVKIVKDILGEDTEHPAKAVYESIEAVKNKAKETGMPYSVLKQVYDRGMAAWRGGHRPGATQVQWALARVNSFVTKSSGTWGGADKDLAAKVKGSK